MLTYQVFVVTGCPKGEHRFEHLVEVVAQDYIDAQILAAQMSSQHGNNCDNHMPLSTEVITDSELTIF